MRASGLGLELAAGFFSGGFAFVRLEVAVVAGVAVALPLAGRDDYDWRLAGGARGGAPGGGGRGGL